MASTKQFIERQEAYETKITELETKLAESERKYEVLYKLFNEQHEIIDQMELECFDEVNRLLKEQKDFYIVEKTEYEKMKQGAKEIVNELKQQLKEKDQAIESLQEINKSLGQTCNNDAKEIERLREKENLLNLIIDGYYTPTNIVERQIREQTQTAISELEKVKQEFNGLFSISIQQEMFDKYIDQQIKSLKGDK